jgi:hypothetical protein
VNGRLENGLVTVAEKDLPGLVVGANCRRSKHGRRTITGEQITEAVREYETGYYGKPLRSPVVLVASAE